MAKNVAARLKQANLVNKTDFDKKLVIFNKQVTSNKTKRLQVQKKLNSIITKDRYSLSWKWNGGYTSKNTLLHIVYLQSIKLSG